MGEGGNEQNCITIQWLFMKCRTRNILIYYQLKGCRLFCNKLVVMLRNMVVPNFAIANAVPELAH